MPGPPPNPNRRRRNVAASARQLTAPKGRAPKCPQGLSPERRAWWKQVWASPVASAWLPIDVPVVERLARLMDRVSTDDDGGYRALTEVRQLEDRLGLSPMARLKLQWKMPEDRQAVVDGGDAPVVSDRFLRVVG